MIPHYERPTKFDLPTSGSQESFSWARNEIDRPRVMHLDKTRKTWENTWAGYIVKSLSIQVLLLQWNLLWLVWDHARAYMTTRHRLRGAGWFPCHCQSRSGDGNEEWNVHRVNVSIWLETSESRRRLGWLGSPRCSTYKTIKNLWQTRVGKRKRNTNGK